MNINWIIFGAGMGAYGVAAMSVVWHLLRIRRNRINLSLSCPCRTHATVYGVEDVGRHGRFRFKLDYYDHRGNRYEKAMTSPFGLRKLKESQIIELYFDPDDPANTISLPVENPLYQDYGFLAVMLSVGFAALGVFAIWAFATRFWTAF